MELQWQLHPKHINVRLATSAAYQYRLQEWTDGKVELTVQHRGDRPSERPIKRFAYKNLNGAFGGAQRFEDKHGYRTVERHVTTEIAPCLRALPDAVVNVVQDTERKVRIARLSANTFGTDSAEDKRDRYEAEYEALCRSLLCCQTTGCYARTEIDQAQCASHRVDTDTDDNTEE